MVMPFQIFNAGEDTGQFLRFVHQQREVLRANVKIFSSINKVKQRHQIFAALTVLTGWFGLGHVEFLEMGWYMSQFYHDVYPPAS